MSIKNMEENNNNEEVNFTFSNIDCFNNIHIPY